MKNTIIPQVLERSQDGLHGFDLYSRLLRDRIIFLNDEVNDKTAQIVIAQLLFLESEDPEKDISFYINSPGGCVHSGLAIYDTMNFIKCDVSTICMGMAASMGAFLLSSGAPGKRRALPNAEIMVHQVSSGTRGTVADMEIDFAHSKKLNNKLDTILSDNCGMKKTAYIKSRQRDKWLGAVDALNFGDKGLIDEVIDKR